MKALSINCKLFYYKKLFLVIIVALFTLKSYSQLDPAQQVTHWLKLQIDNDFLVIGKFTDRYYSFGNRIDFSYKNANANILNIGFGLNGYTPNYKHLNSIVELRRPFTGWTFGYFNYLILYNKSMISIGSEVGNFGKGSGASQFQNGIHKLLDNEKVDGWENQQISKLGANLLLSINTVLYGKDHYMLLGNISSSFGNIFTFINPSIGFRYSSHTQNAYSPLLLQQNLSNELSYLIEYSIGIKYSFYDASLQGEYFSVAHYIETKHLISNTIYSNLSLQLNYKRWSLLYGVSYQSKQVEKNKKHLFGTLSSSYAF